jgi:hypothetical protein
MSIALIVGEFGAPEKGRLGMAFGATAMGDPA